MSPELYPSPPPEPPLPEFVSGMVPEEMKKLLIRYKSQKKKARKQWVTSMTDQQLLAYLEDNLKVPSPPIPGMPMVGKTINRMLLEGVVNWVAGFKSGVLGE